MFLFIEINANNAETYTNSNTSHVLIYQIDNLLKTYPIGFKYISCSYLSMPKYMKHHFVIEIQIHLMFLFIKYYPIQKNL